jgi:hypothetical protein
MTEPIATPAAPARNCALCEQPITGPSLPVHADNGSTMHVHPLPCTSYTLDIEHSTPEKITDAEQCKPDGPLASATDTEFRELCTSILVNLTEARVTASFPSDEPPVNALVRTAIENLYTDGQTQHATAVQDLADEAVWLAADHARLSLLTETLLARIGQLTATADRAPDSWTDHDGTVYDLTRDMADLDLTPDSSAIADGADSLDNSGMAWSADAIRELERRDTARGNEIDRLTAQLAATADRAPKTWTDTEGVEYNLARDLLDRDGDRWVYTHTGQGDASADTVPFVALASPGMPAPDRSNAHPIPDVIARFGPLTPALTEAERAARHEAVADIQDISAQLEVGAAGEPAAKGLDPGAIDREWARRRAAEFLADEARDATALAIVAQRAHLDAWGELGNMSRAEADAYLAAVLAEAGSATVTATWPDGASETVAPAGPSIADLSAAAMGQMHPNDAAALDAERYTD